MSFNVPVFTVCMAFFPSTSGQPATVWFLDPRVPSTWWCFDHFFKYFRGCHGLLLWWVSKYRILIRNSKSRFYVMKSSQSVPRIRLISKVSSRSYRQLNWWRRTSLCESQWSHQWRLFAIGPTILQYLVAKLYTAEGIPPWASWYDVWRMLPNDSRGSSSLVTGCFRALRFITNESVFKAFFVTPVRTLGTFLTPCLGYCIWRCCNLFVKNCFLKRLRHVALRFLHSSLEGRLARRRTQCSFRNVHQRYFIDGLRTVEQCRFISVWRKVRTWQLPQANALVGRPV